MKVQDGIIQMTIEDFRQIIKEEVAKQGAEAVAPNNLFNEVSVRPKDLLDVNKNHSISDITYHITNTVGEPIWIRELDTVFSEHINKNELGEVTHNSGIGSNDLHDLIRKLSLSIYGVNKNRDLKKKDYESVQELYMKIKNFILVEYDLRLNRIEEINGKA